MSASAEAVATAFCQAGDVGGDWRPDSRPAERNCESAYAPHGGDLVDDDLA